MIFPLSSLAQEKSGKAVAAIPLVAVAMSAFLFAPGLGLVHSDDASAASCSALKAFFSGQSCVVEKPVIQKVKPQTKWTTSLRELHFTTAFAPVVSATSLEIEETSSDPSSTAASVEVQTRAVQKSAGGILIEPGDANSIFVQATPAASNGDTQAAAESVEVRLRATAENNQSQLVVSEGCGGDGSGGKGDCFDQSTLTKQSAAKSTGPSLAPGSTSLRGTPGSHVSLSGSVALSGTVSAGSHTVSVNNGVSVNQNVGVAATTAPGVSSGFGFGNAMSSASSVGSGTAGANAMGHGDSLSESASSMADAVSGAANDGLGGGVGIGAGIGGSASVD